MNQQLVDYLRQYKDKYPLDSLKAALIQQGHSKEEVEKAAKLATGKSSKNTLLKVGIVILVIFLILIGLIVAAGFIVWNKASDFLAGGEMSESLIENKAIQFLIGGLSLNKTCKNESCITSKENAGGFFDSYGSKGTCGEATEYKVEYFEIMKNSYTGEIMIESTIMEAFKKTKNSQKKKTVTESYFPAQPPLVDARTTNEIRIMSSQTNPDNTLTSTTIDCKKRGGSWNCFESTFTMPLVDFSATMGVVAENLLEAFKEAGWGVENPQEIFLGKRTILGEEVDCYKYTATSSKVYGDPTEVELCKTCDGIVLYEKGSSGLGIVGKAVRTLEESADTIVGEEPSPEEVIETRYIIERKATSLIRKVSDSDFEPPVAPEPLPIGPGFTDEDFDINDTDEVLDEDWCLSGLKETHTVAGKQIEMCCSEYDTLKSCTNYNDNYEKDFKYEEGKGWVLEREAWLANGQLCVKVINLETGEPFTQCMTFGT